MMDQLEENTVKLLNAAMKAAKKQVIDYCREDGIPKKEYQGVLEAMESLDFGYLSHVDIFLGYDALGVSERTALEDAYYKIFTGLFDLSMARRAIVRANASSQEGHGHY